ADKPTGRFMIRGRTRVVKRHPGRLVASTDLGGGRRRSECLLWRRGPTRRGGRRSLRWRGRGPVQGVLLRGLGLSDLVAEAGRLRAPPAAARRQPARRVARRSAAWRKDRPPSL